MTELDDPSKSVVPRGSRIVERALRLLSWDWQPERLPYKAVDRGKQNSSPDLHCHAIFRPGDEDQATCGVCFQLAHS